MTKDQIKVLALQHGFKLREQSDGSQDLNPYVYDFARALLGSSVEAPDGWIRWYGGEMPVSADALVDLELCDGSVYSRVRAGDCSWKPKLYTYVIVKYKVS